MEKVTREQAVGIAERHEKNLPCPSCQSKRDCKVCILSRYILQPPPTRDAARAREFVEKVANAGHRACYYGYPSVHEADIAHYVAELLSHAGG